MLGVLLTLLFTLGVTGIGGWAIGRWTADLDQALRLASHALAGLGIFGLLTLGVAILPGGTNWGVFVVGVLALAGYIPLYRQHVSLTRPEGWRQLVLLACVLAVLCGLVGVLSPSDSWDWDTIAYHLAAPKIWILDGRLHYISFIHQSNFPLTVDGLYIWGLRWGGESGAKAFSLCFAIAGGLALFGAGRSRYGESAGWWSLLAYVAIPMVIWESGTGYIDVSNGLYVALALLFAAFLALDPTRREYVWLGGLFLGFAAGSKYTGLQTLILVALVLIAIGLARGAGQRGLARGGVLTALIALVVCSPWYVRNLANTGNPVYPFFYKIIGGRNWDAYRDEIYRNQQQDFGAGREMGTETSPYTANKLEPLRIGGAILGLAYQPGRYADPQPDRGLGFPFVSLGAVSLAALLCFMFSGRLSPFEGVILATVLLSLAAWFVLSEQSRYILGLALPMCVLGGGAVTRLKVGPLLAACIALQFLAGVFVVTRYGDRFAEKLKVVLGTETADDYLKANVGFYEPSKDLNDLARGGRVALFDEVFGYFLDVPYFWANPGHSMEMGYEGMSSSDDLVKAFHRMGITYVYINLGQTFGDRAKIEEWLSAAGLGGGPPQPYPLAERKSMVDDLQSRYKPLLAEAVAAHQLQLVKAFGASRLIFSVQ